MESTRKGGLSGAGLKWIAIITMLIDHIGAVVLMPLISISNMQSGQMPMELMTVYTILRTIGRISFPIFCFLIVEGFFHTKDAVKYNIRLAIFALLSEVPFDLSLFGKVFETSHQNIFFTLAIGLFAIIVFHKLRFNMTLAAFMIVLLAAIAAEMINTDYGAFGVLLIFVFYFFRDKPLQRFLAFVVLCIVNVVYTYVQMGYGFHPMMIAAIIPALLPVLSLIPIHIYNGERGNQPKYFFYLFYPLHLLILYFIRMAVV